MGYSLRTALICEPVQLITTNVNSWNSQEFGERFEVSVFSSKDPDQHEAHDKTSVRRLPDSPAIPHSPWLY
jgi:hypothetical protein